MAKSREKSEQEAETLILCYLNSKSEKADWQKVIQRGENRVSKFEVPAEKDHLLLHPHFFPLNYCTINKHIIEC